jgi:hypothetical protein
LPRNELNNIVVNIQILQLERSEVTGSARRLDAGDSVVIASNGVAIDFNIW